MNLHTLKRLPEVGALVLLMVVGIGFFAFTNPATLPPATLMLAFFIMFGVLYFACKLTLGAIGVKDKLSPGLYTGVLLGGAALPVLLLALQSLGQLTPRDTITLAVLYVAGYFYLSRTASPSK